jgi:NadR type nicotinamide-nucleotide adenylyltransferase
MKRIVVTGSECTGKTTLAQKLAAHFNTLWVPEFARSYAVTRRGILTHADVEPIARGQMALEDRCASIGSELLILDTDLLSTVIYSHHYYGDCPAWIEKSCRERLGSLYLLLHPDVPWIADGVRDRGDRRIEMHQLFQNMLLRVGAAFVDIAGDWDARLRMAVQAVEKHLQQV